MNLERRLKAMESRVPDVLMCAGTIGGVAGIYPAQALYEAVDGSFSKVVSGNDIHGIELILQVIKRSVIA